MPISLSKPLNIKFWARFNRFCRRVSDPKLTFAPVSGDPDTCLIRVNDKVVGTLNRRPNEWYLISALETSNAGQRATLQADDIESIFIGLVTAGLSLPQAIHRQVLLLESGAIYL